MEKRRFILRVKCTSWTCQIHELIFQIFGQYRFRTRRFSQIKIVWVIEIVVEQNNLVQAFLLKTPVRVIIDRSRPVMYPEIA